jgi:hypothetical protein
VAGPIVILLIGAAQVVLAIVSAIMHRRRLEQIARSGQTPGPSPIDNLPVNYLIQGIVGLVFVVSAILRLG